MTQDKELDCYDVFVWLINEQITGEEALSILKSNPGIVTIVGAYKIASFLSLYAVVKVLLK